MEFTSLAFRFALGFVFLLAGLSKLSQPQRFARAIANYGLLPRPLVDPVARWLPRLEVAGGTLLLAGMLQIAVSLGLAILLLSFSLAVSVNLARGRRIDCGCFGPGVTARITWWTVFRNLLLAAMAILLATYPSASLLPPGSWEPRSEGAVAAEGAIAVAVAVISIVLALQLVNAAIRLWHATRVIDVIVSSEER